jgi:hypothetical protein
MALRVIKITIPLYVYKFTTSLLLICRLNDLPLCDCLCASVYSTVNVLRNFDTHLLVYYYVHAHKLLL